MAHDHHGHSHGHGHHHHAPSHGRAFSVGIALNSVYVVVELSIGLLIGSLGLISDALHNASDVLSLLLAWLGSRLSRRGPSKRFTYGLKRAPIVASLLNALLLFGAMGAVTWEAIRRFSDPAPIPGMVLVWVTLVGLVVNFGTAFMFVRGRDDLNIRGAFLHMMADGLVTLGVLIAGVAINLTGALWLDSFISLLIVVVVLWSTLGLFRDALRLSVDAVPANINPDDVHAYLAAVDDVNEVHDLHIWALSTTETALTAHLVTDDPQTANNQLIARLCRELRERFDIVHVTLQFEHGDPVDPCGLASVDVV